MEDTRTGWRLLFQQDTNPKQTWKVIKQSFDLGRFNINPKHFFHVFLVNNFESHLLFPLFRCGLLCVSLISTKKQQLLGQNVKKKKISVVLFLWKSSFWLVTFLIGFFYLLSICLFPKAFILILQRRFWQVLCFVHFETFETLKHLFIYF